MCLIFFISALTLSVEVFGAGEINVLSKPPSIEFRGHEELDSDTLKEMAAMSYGFTTYSTSEWSGMKISDPFNFAQAVAVIAVHGVPSLGISDGHTFPFVTISPLNDIFTSLEGKILDRYQYGDNQTLVEINLEEDVKANEISLNKGPLEVKRASVSFLKEEEDDDSRFLGQIALWRSILDKIEEKGVPVDGLPDLYWFNLRGLHPIIDLYGANSNAAIEAKEMVTSTIEQMKEVFDQAYHNKTLFLVLTSDAAHTRRFRRQSELVADRNLAPDYDENYPVFFNIFLWFTIAFIMAIIATSMVTATMDPGRDSIIYRMTSTRMKKDN